MNSTRRLAFSLLLPGLLALAIGAAAEGIPPPPSFAAVPLPATVPAEAVVLLVKGLKGRESPLALDLATLKALPQTSFRSLDPWDGKEHLFTGVRLADFLAWLGVEASTGSILFTARNGYSIPVLRADFTRKAYLLAWALDGKDLMDDPGTKKRGPLQVAIDFAADKDLPVEIYKHQLIWQLSELLVR